MKSKVAQKMLEEMPFEIKLKAIIYSYEQLKDSLTENGKGYLDGLKRALELYKEGK